MCSFGPACESVGNKVFPGALPELYCAVLFPVGICLRPRYNGVELSEHEWGHPLPKVWRAYVSVFNSEKKNEFLVP